MTVPRAPPPWQPDDWEQSSMLMNGGWAMGTADKRMARALAQEDLQRMVLILRALCPGLSKISKLNRSSIKKYPQLEKIFKNHSWSSAYLVQLFKQPVVAPCDCLACVGGYWQAFRLGDEIGRSLPHQWQLPLPIPDPSNPQKYCIYDEAKKMPFTDEHQP